MVLVLSVSCWALFGHRVKGLKKASLPPLHGLVFDMFLACIACTPPHPALQLHLACSEERKPQGLLTFVFAKQNRNSQSQCLSIKGLLHWGLCRAKRICGKSPGPFSRRLHTPYPRVDIHQCVAHAIENSIF